MNNTDLHCGSCGRELADSDYATEVNPPGGYGRPQLLVCDPCIESERWAEWRERKCRIGRRN